ncbi:MAG TPA: endonuclease Q family protein, partial [bacterium]
MSRVVADLHIHSHYSRATSPDMEPAALNRWAKTKGIDILGTGDFTHPQHFSHLKQCLVSNGKGLFRLKDDPNSTHFLLTAEVSNMYPDKGKGRRIHTLLFAPGFDEVEKINGMLSGWGKMASDGRPIFGLPAKHLAETVLNVSDRCMVIPAHVWTPWFSLFGSESGYDSIEEAYGDMTPHIRAVETGLSSDPSMNWRLSALDSITLISNSDAHSPAKLGREANVLDCGFDYDEIVLILKTKNRDKFLETVEFFPEEGKYHYDGHRACNIRFSPSETQKHGGICPVCGKSVVVGVMSRVEQLADRPEGFKPDNAVPF